MVKCVSIYASEYTRKQICNNFCINDFSERILKYKLFKSVIHMTFDCFCAGFSVAFRLLILFLFFHFYRVEDTRSQSKEPEVPQDVKQRQQYKQRKHRH